MNVVVCGHIDHGKSTLIGRLLYDGHFIPDSKITEVERYVQEMKRKFEFAYFIDAFSQELKEEKTIDTTSIKFRSEKREYTLTDVPGHKEFIKNMLTGASQADAAILVVDLTKGIEEQTRRHLFLLKLLGIKEIVIFFNKVDLLPDSSTVRVLEIKVEPLVEELKRELGKDFKLTVGSAYQGWNVVSKKEIIYRDEWIFEPLVKILDSLEIKEVHPPTRVQVQGTYKGVTFKRTLSGYSEGICWENIEDLPKPERGTIIGDPDMPSPKKEFKAQVTSIEGKIRKNQKLTLKLGTFLTEAWVGRIDSRLSSETGEELPKRSGFPTLSLLESALVIMKTKKPTPVERFSEIPALGRFSLLDEKGKTLGLGIVL